jgi:hypothetical protein
MHYHTPYIFTIDKMPLSHATTILKCPWIYRISWVNIKGLTPSLCIYPQQQGLHMQHIVKAPATPSCAWMWNDRVLRTCRYYTTGQNCTCCYNINIFSRPLCALLLAIAIIFSALTTITFTQSLSSRNLFDCLHDFPP